MRWGRIPREPRELQPVTISMSPLKLAERVGLGRCEAIFSGKAGGPQNPLPGYAPTGCLPFSKTGRTAAIIFLQSG